MRIFEHEQDGLTTRQPYGWSTRACSVRARCCCGVRLRIP
jgi:hypothetical protein